MSSADEIPAWEELRQWALDVGREARLQRVMEGHRRALAPITLPRDPWQPVAGNEPSDGGDGLHAYQRAMLDMLERGTGLYTAQREQPDNQRMTMDTLRRAMDLIRENQTDEELMFNGRPWASEEVRDMLVPRRDDALDAYSFTGFGEPRPWFQTNWRAIDDVDEESDAELIAEGVYDEDEE